MSFSECIEKISANKTLLLVASILLCVGFLGTHDLWTHEQRWADVVSMMFLRHDYLHPYLGATPYYDKPLLTYWLMAGSAIVMQQFSAFAIRFPSAIFTLIALSSAYWLVKSCYNKKLALLFVWMFLATFYFIFWGRIASADIFNIAGIMTAIAFYAAYRHRATFIHFLFFFSLVSITALFKGLIGAVVIFIVVAIDVLLRGSWRQYCRWSFLIAGLVGVFLFCVPFLLSAVYPDANFIAQKNSGLYLVYKENILRFFKPFDHQDPFYIYLIYLPLYSFPWIVFLVPALVSRMRAWSRMDVTSRWVLLSFLVLFVFFTVSGSRRSYYILSVVPFALLLIIDWLHAVPRFMKSVQVTAVCTAFILIIVFTVLQPYYYAHYGIASFMQQVLHQDQGEKIKPQEIVLLAVKSKIAFYAGLPPTAIYHSPHDISIVIQHYVGRYAIAQSVIVLPKVILTKQEYVPYIQNELPGVYEEVMKPHQLTWHKKMISNQDGVVALIRRDV